MKRTFSVTKLRPRQINQRTKARLKKLICAKRELSADFVLVARNAA